MPIGDAADKGRRNHQGTIHSHRAHRVIEHALMSPLLKGLFNRLRKAVVGNPSPILFDAVILIRLQELVGANQPQSIVGVARHHVLPALAAGQRHHRSPHPIASRLIGQHAAVFIIGMGDNRHHARPGMQPLQFLPKAVRSTVFCERLSIDRGGYRGSARWKLLRWKNAGPENHCGAHRAKR